MFAADEETFQLAKRNILFFFKKKKMQKHPKIFILRSKIRKEVKNMKNHIRIY